MIYEQCKQCELALFCMLKSNMNSMCWCMNCEGWWLKKQKIFVDCVHFLGTEDISDVKRIPYPHIIRVVREKRDANIYTHLALKRCPICSSERFDYDEMRVTKIIKGMSIGE